jgi:hypothetical protein
MKACSQLVSGNGKLSFLIQEKKEKGDYSMVAHACNPSAQSLSQENCEFEASLSYKARPCLKRKQKNVNKA